MLWEEEEEEAWAGGWKEYHKSKSNEMLEEVVIMQRGQGERGKNHGSLNILVPSIRCELAETSMKASKVDSEQTLSWRLYNLMLLEGQDLPKS